MRRNQKWTALLLTFMMLINCMCINAFAAGETPVLLSAPAGAVSGATVKVSVKADATCVADGKLVFTYDADLLSSTDLAAASAWEDKDDVVFSVNDKAGSIILAFASEKVAAKGEIFTLTFKALAKGEACVALDGSKSYITGAELITDQTATITITAEQSDTPERPEPDIDVPTNPSVPGTSSKPSTEVTTNPDGSTTTTTTDKNGNVTKTTETKDGTTSTVVTDKNGNVTEMTAEVSKEAAVDGSVTLPLEVKAADSAEEAVAVEITVPASVLSVKVEIPVQNVTYSSVVVLVHEDGTEEIISKTALTEDGNLAITVDGSVTVKVVDNAKSFTDANMWAKNEIAFVTSRNIFNGTGDNTFSPNTNMTRAMLMTVLARLDGADASGADWAEKGKQWAVENGISDGSNLSANISRQDLVTMLYRYAGKPATSGSLDGFSDAASVSSYAVDAMKWAVENGIISGMGDGTLAAQGNATRAQLAKILTKFINL